MSEAGATTAPRAADGDIVETIIQPPTKNAQQYFHELRQWVIAHCSTGHIVRQAAYGMALTANVHRLVKYGPDETLNHMTARDLMNLLIYTNGEIAEWLMRAAFTRALIEDDREVYEILAAYPFMPECTSWYWKLVQALIGQSPDPKETGEWVEALPLEEKSLARLLCARAFPDTVHFSWLDDVPEHCPAIAYQLARFAMGKPDCRNAIENWLRERPLVRNQAFAA